MAVIRGGYWHSSEAEKFPPESIQTAYFTHLFYATVTIVETDPQTHTFKIFISDIDKKWMGRFTSTISQNAGVKCFLSIGKDTKAGRTLLSNMVSTPDGRKSFIDDSIKKARKYGFHGQDLYWKYPATENEFDMPNLGLLFKEWRDSLIGESRCSRSPKLSLSTIVYFAPKFSSAAKDKKAYPFKAIKDNVDFVNLVCYDYYGSEDITATAEHALLYDQYDKKSTHSGISSWIDDAGVPEGILVMGLPLYGRTWTLEDQSKHGIGDPATGVGLGNGVMDYGKILKFNQDPQATVVDDKNDSEYSIKGKVQYAKDRALGGYFFWVLGMDEDYILPQKALETWS